MSVLSYQELPLNINEKYEILKQKFPGEDDSILRHISNLQSIRYIVDRPVFTHYSIKDNKVLFKSISCGTLPISSIKSSPFPDAFFLYTIKGNYLRGAYAEYDGEAYQRMRNSKIDEIIGQ